MCMVSVHHGAFKSTINDIKAMVLEQDWTMDWTGTQYTGSVSSGGELVKIKTAPSNVHT